MNISFEKAEHNSGVITLAVEKADYEAHVAKELKKIRQRVNMPGFRPGTAPASIIAKRFGKEVLQEAVNKIMGEELTKYIRQENLNVLGSPMLREEEIVVEEFWKQEGFTFVFDVAIMPEFDGTISSADQLSYYQIEVTDQMVAHIEKSIAQMEHKEFVPADSYAPGCELYAHLGELDAEGNLLEGGKQVEGKPIPIRLFENEEEKAKFADAKQDDVITFNPAKALGENTNALRTLFDLDDEAALPTADFSCQVSRVERLKETIDSQEVFDHVLGEGVATSPEEFRAALRKSEEEKLEANSLYKGIIDLKAYMVARVGKLDYPEALLKRILAADNPDKDAAFVEKAYAESIDQLTWEMCRDQMAKQLDVKVEKADVEKSAELFTRMQFASYGLNYIPREMVKKYAENMLNDKEKQRDLFQQALDSKLMKAVLETATIDRKVVSEAEFNALFATKEEPAEQTEQTEQE